MANSLVVLGCSATKFDVEGHVPAVHLYDGPMFRTLRSHLRGRKWSKNLSVGVLSAKYGLIGAVAPIESYDQRMTADQAAQLRTRVNECLSAFATTHERVHLVLGRDYMQAIDSDRLRAHADVRCVEGPIGMKLHELSTLLNSLPSARRDLREVAQQTSDKRPLYFLPDWDDFVDAEFDFLKDKFSADDRSDRKQAHITQLLRPNRICDGILVSLAQNLGTKGLLRHLPPENPELLRPLSVRDHFGLSPDQWAFGDCGAFSYAKEHDPAISIEQAVAVYELYDFDLGASVDHIPLSEIVNDEGEREALSIYERKRRVKVTRDNAEAFMRVWRARGCRFTPVGVIQALDAAGYARQVSDYLDMGYNHIALGGLVPRSDEDIRDIIWAVNQATAQCDEKPWLHLFGVFRPNLQRMFRQSGINSFDSATYFRKAWLRSDQNYLGQDGEWYAAVRIPPTSDPRTMIRLKQSGKRESTIRRMEKDALAALRKYDAGSLDINSCLSVILSYDRLLGRGEFSSDSLRQQYRRTLEDKPWEKCKCRICKEIGVDALVFRGLNRNKRRGAHNTRQLYRKLGNPLANN